MPKTDPKDSPGDVNLETHPLVARLHADPDELTDLVTLAGYLGPSKREGYVRLYADLTFRNYYEIPTEGIVSTSPADASDENSPTTVHVSGGTQVDKVSVTSQSTEARFLQGSIASDYLGGAGAGAGGWTMAGCTVTLNCQQGAAQVGAPSMVYSCWCNITKNNCQQGAAQAGQAYWPASPTCWCWHTQQNCQQAGAQANAEPWPASPTCWCNITRNCAQQAQMVPMNTLFHNTCACTYDNCGQAGAAEVGCSWPASPTCWCVHTQQGCT